MNFTEAFKQMECGEKVIRGLFRNHITKPYLWIEKDGVLFYQGEEGERYLITKIDLTATDWEIYTPEPNLNPCGCGGTPKIVEGVDAFNETTYKAKCSCGVETIVFGCKNDAVYTWNTAHPIQEPKPRTNFEALLVPWTKTNPKLSICNYKDKFVLCGLTCNTITCEECNKRFVAHLQEEYKEEVKQ